MGNVLSKFRRLSIGAEKPSRYPDLPEELMVEIMSWLPPESLIRFKCVCKSWHTLISALSCNPTFVAKHLRNANNKILLSASLGYSNPTERLSLLTIFGYDHDENDNIRCVTKALNLPIDPAMKFVSFYHCDGIICIASDDPNVVLFNPAINESRVLPQSGLLDNCCIMDTGFGYDCRANDYKVVRFGYNINEPGFDRKAEVYSLGTDSWREIERQIQFNGSFKDEEVYCKGVYYWRKADHNHMILSFDMSDEVFRRIPLPANLQDLSLDLNIRLAVWNESVAFFYLPYEWEDPRVIEVFGMDDRVGGGARESCNWIKHLRIRPIEGIISPWTFWKNDELLMVGGLSSNEVLVSYNLRSKKIRILQIYVELGWYFGFLYVGSLVSVRRTE